MNEIPSLSRSVSEYVRLELPSNTQLFIVNENLEATVAGRHTCVSRTHRLAIHQFIANNDRIHRIQIFTSLPLEQRFRVLLLDWDINPRIYMLGIRYEGIKKPVKITSSITDSSGIKYHDSILTQRIDTHMRMLHSFPLIDRIQCGRMHIHTRFTKIQLE